MTVVEFFDKVSIDNMVSCITMKPARIIFIGDRKTMNKYKADYERFIRKKELDVELEYININRNSIANIINVLEKIVSEDDYCVFDLTGGEDLVLVAMGIVYERYKDTKKIQMHRFNVTTGSIFDCDNDGIIPYEGEPEISVDDLITLHGGTLLRNGRYDTNFWYLTADFVNDVLKLWHLCKRNPGRWNSMVNTIAAVIGTNEELYCSAKTEDVRRRMKAGNQEFAWLDMIADELEEIGVISNLNKDEDNISFMIKNEQIRLLMSKSGTILEVSMLILALTCEDSQGNAVFTDAETGVYIDWNATIHSGSDAAKKDTVNEIDLILMRGIQPVFISCKNGRITDDEFYKLNTVAERFGGPHVKKVLVCSYMGNVGEDAKAHLRQRAEDMGIDIIESVHEMSDEDIQKQLRRVVM